jgi:prepilin-type processing-associated H-X9-DG protein
MDESALYCGFVPILPPNAPACGSIVRNATITPSSYHPGGVNTGMADGGCRFFSETVDYTTDYENGTTGEGAAWRNQARISGMTVHGIWGALGNRDGGESVSF